MLSNWEEEKKRVLQEELGVAEDIAAMDSVNGGDGLGGSVLGRSILGQSTRRVSLCAFGIRVAWQDRGLRDLDRGSATSDMESVMQAQPPSICVVRQVCHY